MRKMVLASTIFCVTFVLLLSCLNVFIGLALAELLQISFVDNGGRRVMPRIMSLISSQLRKEGQVFAIELTAVVE